MRPTRLAVAVLATLAAGVLTAGGAFADPLDEYVVTGAVSAANIGTQVFTINAGKMECKKLALSFGTGVGDHTTLETSLADLRECSAFGIAYTIKFEGCNLDYLEPRDSEEEAKDLVHSGKVTVVCPKGKTIVLSSAICKMTIPAQGPLGAVTWTNSGANLLAEAHIEGLEYTEKGTKCFNIKKSPETFKNGTYVGELKALNVTID